MTARTVMAQILAVQAATLAARTVIPAQKIRGRTMVSPSPEFPLDRPVPRNYAEALAALRDPALCASQKYQRAQWKAARIGLHPDVAEFERTFLKRTFKLGIPLYTDQAVRTRAEQDELFALGRSKAKGGQSPHNYGLA